MTLLDLVTVTVLLLVGVRLVGAARLSLSRRGRSRIAAIVGDLRLRHFLLAQCRQLALLLPG